MEAAALPVHDLYALFGHYELWLWMITSAAISLSGVIFAGRIAYRLTDAPPERRWAALAAGIFAGLALLGSRTTATTSSAPSRTR